MIGASMVVPGPRITTGHIARIGPALGVCFRDPDGNDLGPHRVDVPA